MSTIRSGLPATLPPTGAQPAVRAAQSDFFRSALAQFQTATAQGGPVQPEVTPLKTEPLRAPTDGRPARPGSLLDIRV